MHRSLLGTLAMVGALSMAQPGLAQDGTAAETANVSDEAPIRARGSNRYLDPDVIRCQRRREAGSFRERRICLTNRQWDEIYRSGNRDAQRIQDMGRLYAGPDG